MTEANQVIALDGESLTIEQVVQVAYGEPSQTVIQLLTFA